MNGSKPYGPSGDERPSGEAAMRFAKAARIIPGAVKLCESSGRAGGFVHLGMKSPRRNDGPGLPLSQRHKHKLDFRDPMIGKNLSLLSLTSSLVACLIMLAQNGCAHTNAITKVGNSGQISRKALQSITDGTSISELENIFDAKCRHQFTAVTNSSRYDCCSFSFAKHYIRYYFVSKNGRLMKIVVPPPYDSKLVATESGRLTVRKPFDPEKRIQVVLSSKDLTGSGLADSIEKSLGRKRESFSVLPAFVITAPLLIPRMAIEAPAIEADYKRNERLARRYDLSRIDIGFTPENVNSVFGHPKKVLSLRENSIICFMVKTRLRE